MTDQHDQKHKKWQTHLVRTNKFDNQNWPRHQKIQTKSAKTHKMADQLRQDKQKWQTNPVKPPKSGQTNLVKPEKSARPTWSSQKNLADQLGQPEDPQNQLGQARKIRQTNLVKPEKSGWSTWSSQKNAKNHKPNRKPTWSRHIFQKQIIFYSQINLSCTMLPKCELGTRSQFLLATIGTPLPPPFKGPI